MLGFDVSPQVEIAMGRTYAHKVTLVAPHNIVCCGTMLYGSVAVEGGLAEGDVITLVTLLVLCCCTMNFLQVTLQAVFAS